MGRPRYCITEDDYLHAYFYLSPKVRSHEIEYLKESQEFSAGKSFNRAASSEIKGKKKQAEALNAWCEKHLTSSEWQKLKQAIRKRRVRWEKAGESTTVTVSTKVRDYLANISERDDVTYNEILEHVLANACSSSRKIPKGRVR